MSSTAPKVAEVPLRPWTMTRPALVTVRLSVRRVVVFMICSLVFKLLLLLLLLLVLCVTKNCLADGTYLIRLGIAVRVTCG